MAITLVDFGMEPGEFSSDIDYPEPSTFQADDLWVLWGNLSLSGGGISALPSGFTLRYEETGGNGIMVCAYKVMTGSESGAIGINHSTEQCSGVWAVFRGVDTSTPFDVSDGTLAGSFSDSPTFNSITPVTDGAWIISHLGGSNHNQPAVTWDSDQTEIDQTAGGSTFSHCSVAYEEVDPAAQNSDYSGMSLSVSTGWDSILTALRPAGGGGGGLAVPVAMHYRKMAGVS